MPLGFFFLNPIETLFRSHLYQQITEVAQILANNGSFEICLKLAKTLLSKLFSSKGVEPLNVYSYQAQPLKASSYLL